MPAMTTAQTGYIRPAMGKAALADDCGLHIRLAEETKLAACFNDLRCTSSMMRWPSCLAAKSRDSSAPRG